MDKNGFNKKGNDDLPRTEIMNAIQNGMNEGRKIKRKNMLKTRLKVSSWVTGTAASVVLASGFFFSPINTVLADMPLIGKLYETFHFETGKELAASNLVKAVNEKASSNGVDLTVTSAYYDGNIIGITINAEGEDLSFDGMDRERSPESGYAFGGEDKDLLPGSRGSLQKTEEGSYVAALEFELKEKELPQDYVLPLHFTQIANKKGNWHFHIPVQQLPVESFKLNASTSSKDRLYTIELTSFSKGKATAMLNYTFKHPAENQEVNLKVLDDQGNRVSLRNDEVVKVIENKVNIEEIKELQLGKIKNTNYLTVYPEVVTLESEERIQLPPLKIQIK